MYPAANNYDPNVMAMLRAQPQGGAYGMPRPAWSAPAPTPTWTLPTTPTSYNMPPAQDSASISSARKPSPQSDAAADAQFEQQLMQMLANAGASEAPGGASPAAAMSAVPAVNAMKGISGHTASGTIIQRPDGGFTDTSNGSGGGITDTLFSKKVLGGVAAAVVAGLAVIFTWKTLAKSEKDKFAKFTKNWSEEHLENLKTAVKEADKEKSDSRIEELREVVKSNYQDLVTRIHEKLEGDSARKATVDSAEAAIGKTHDAALEVLQDGADIDAVLKKVDEQGAETASKLAEVQTLFEHKS